MRLLFSALGFSLAVVCLALGGCGNRPKLYPVSGTVTHAGRPLPAGVIFFDPDVTKQNKGPQGYAIIKDGRYDTAALGGKGVGGGAYLARIDGFDGKPGRELPMGNVLFTQFQQPIDLPEAASTRDFDVPTKKR
jgi:hypothetical protein